MFCQRPRLHVAYPVSLRLAVPSPPHAYCHITWRGTTAIVIHPWWLMTAMAELDTWACNTALSLSNDTDSWLITDADTAVAAAQPCLPRYGERALIWRLTAFHLTRVTSWPLELWTDWVWPFIVAFNHRKDYGQKIVVEQSAITIVSDSADYRPIR